MSVVLLLIQTTLVVVRFQAKTDEATSRIKYVPHGQLSDVKRAVDVDVFPGRVNVDCCDPQFRVSTGFGLTISVVH